MWLLTHFHDFILPPADKTDGNNYTAFACEHTEFTYNSLKKWHMFSFLDFAYLLLWGIYGKLESYLLWIPWTQWISETLFSQPLTIMTKLRTLKKALCASQQDWQSWHGVSHLSCSAAYPTWEATSCGICYLWPFTLQRTHKISRWNTWHWEQTLVPWHWSAFS